MANARLDIHSGQDRFLFVSGQGHCIGFPTFPGVTSTSGSGVPTNGIAGFVPGAIFFNFKGTVASALYVNVGTNLSATWLNIA
jgi:hypothetical protein